MQIYERINALINKLSRGSASELASTAQAIVDEARTSNLPCGTDAIPILETAAASLKSGDVAKARTQLGLASSRIRGGDVRSGRR